MIQRAKLLPHLGNDPIVQASTFPFHNMRMKYFAISSGDFF